MFNLFGECERDVFLRIFVVLRVIALIMLTLLRVFDALMVSGSKPTASCLWETWVS